MIDTILFDLDGTLIDLGLRIAVPVKNAFVEVAGFLPELDVIHSMLEKMLQSLGKKSRWIKLKLLWNLGKAGELSFFANLRFLFKSVRAYNANRYKFKFVVGAEEILNWSINNFKVGIVTNAPKKVITKALELLPTLRKVKTIVTDENLKHQKPHPEPVLEACKLLGSKPSETVYIGDLNVDIISGNEAGALTIGYLGELGVYTKKLLTDSKPDYLLQSHLEILELLKKLTQK